MVIDTWIEQLTVAWLRRRWPVLRLVPARWVRPVIKPIVLRLRRSLAVAALVVAMVVVIAVTLLICGV